MSIIGGAVIPLVMGIMPDMSGGNIPSPLSLRSATNFVYVRFLRRLLVRA